MVMTGGWFTTNLMAVIQPVTNIGFNPRTIGFIYGTTWGGPSCMMLLFYTVLRIVLEWL